jgi:NACalpha-BTF3-like transcription factor
MVPPPRPRKRAPAAEKTATPNHEYVVLLMSQTGCTEKEAKKALQMAKGSVVSAVVWIHYLKP